MAKRHKRRIGIAIDMTPMVDIGFLLLIFYMTTTQFKPPEREHVTLAASHSEIKVPDAGLINITINKNDNIFIEYVTKNEQTGEVYRESPEVTLNTLNLELAKARSKFPSAYVLIKADRDSKYGTIREIMNTLQDVKIDHFSLMTEMKTDPITPSAAM
jgi:biopolymer transport protein ExbD